MKTIHLKLFVTIVLMGAVFAATGQPARGSNNQNRVNSDKKKETAKVEKRKDYRNNVQYRGESRPVNRELNRSGVKYRDNRKVESNRNHTVYSAPVKVKTPKQFQGNKNYYYAPRYGHTVRHFHTSPVVFHAKGNKFYFHNDHFYRYHKGIGYVWIDNPYGMVFNRLPHGAIRVHINGSLHYRIGDVYLVRNPYGYEVVSLPARYYKSRPVIHISASF
jgi:hypothetical protein